MSEKKEVKAAEKEHRALLRPFDEMERWYENLFPRGWLRPFTAEGPWSSAFFAHRMPAVDVVDREDEVIVRAEVPGVRKEDLKVSLSDGTISIKGHTEHAEEEKRDDYYRHEMSCGDFTRTLELPAGVDGKNAAANMKDGVLEIRIPKLEPAKRNEVKIEIH